jgi:uncharacterized protein YyaL (SSP411 family)
MANHLSLEKSLYLRQHGNNPVAWWAWGEAALAAAQAQNKPILVSIGYSTCHWCHVMAHESFESPYIADLMNRHFICIKVDREERPDIDHLYMQAVQLITQQSGWPLNVFCLPDGRPFFGGTYFPAEDRGYGIIPWPQLLMRISDYYQKNKQELENNAINICKSLELTHRLPIGPDELNLTSLTQAAKTILASYNAENGGFEIVPKFPASMILEFLLSVQTAQTFTEGAIDRTQEVTTHTLEVMATRGLYDQIGGGFFRYCVDAQWHQPHFEKMLYDNALLVQAYLIQWLNQPSALYKAIIQETIHWLLTEMLSENNLFFAAIDADTNEGEGRVYLWTRQEITAVLNNADATKSFFQVYEVTSEEAPTLSHLRLKTNNFSLRSEQALNRLKLYQARSKRPQPHTDKKHILVWNNLAIKSLALSGFYLEEDAWFQQAVRSLDTAWDLFVHDTDRLYAVSYDNHPCVKGLLADYAVFAEALLAVAGKIDFYEPGKSSLYIERAQLLTDSCLRHFQDDTEAGFFLTPDDSETFIIRQKLEWDNAIPSGSSALVHVLSSLYALTGSAHYRKALDTLRNLHGALLANAPKGLAYAGTGWTYALHGIIVIKANAVNDFQALRRLLLKSPYRPIFCLSSNNSQIGSGYTLCKGEVCLNQVKTVEALAPHLLKNCE